MDFALIRLHGTTGRGQLSIRASGPLEREEIFSLNFQDGKAMSWVRGGKANEVRGNGHFYATLEAAPGSSGGPVFSLETHEIIGIISGGRDRREQVAPQNPLPDTDPDRTCGRSLRIPCDLDRLGNESWGCFHQALVVHTKHAIAYLDPSQPGPSCAEMWLEEGECARLQRCIEGVATIDTSCTELYSRRIPSTYREGHECSHLPLSRRHYTYVCRDEVYLDGDCHSHARCEAGCLYHDPDCPPPVSHNDSQKRSCLFMNYFEGECRFGQRCEGGILVRDEKCTIVNCESGYSCRLPHPNEHGKISNTIVFEQECLDGWICERGCLREPLADECSSH